MSRRSSTTCSNSRRGFRGINPPEATETQKEQLAYALAQGNTLAEAARHLGISDRSARRWRSDPEFTERVRELRRAFTEKAFAEVERSSVVAAATLATLCRSGSEKIQLGAARSLLELSLKLREQWDIRERLEAVERFMQEHGETRP